MKWLRRNAWWLVPEIAIASTITQIFLDKPGFDEQLAQQAVSILESVSPAEHHNHGHDVTDADRVLCAAEPFGFEPRTATRIEDVTTIYAYFLCAAAEPGTDWDWASRISGPVVITLGQDPPGVRIAEAGLGYPERVRAMIPEDLRERAFGGFTDPSRPSELRRRYQSEIS